MSRNQTGTNQPQPNVVQADVHGRENEEDEIIEFNDSTRGDIANEMDETRATEPNKTPSPTVLRLKEQQLLEREDALLKKEREYYRKLAAMEKLQKALKDYESAQSTLITTKTTTKKMKKKPKNLTKTLWNL